MSSETLPAVDIHYLAGASEQDIGPRGNPFQQLQWVAQELQDKIHVRVIPGHLGNPRAPQFEPTNKALGYFYEHRSQFPAYSAGYQDMAGNPDVRQHLAETIMRLNRIEDENNNRGPSHEDNIVLTKDNILGMNGGTGALNVAIKVFAKGATILVPEPAYAPWFDIANHLERNIETYPLLPKDNYTLKAEAIEPVINKLPADQPVVLISHNPHNPTSKTLTEKEARETAAQLDTLSAKHPNLFIIQEDLYLATTTPNMGIYTPLPYLNKNTRAHTIVLHSPSKMGLAQDRGGVAIAFEEEILKKLRDTVSIDSLGSNPSAMLATALTLRHIANGGRDALGEPDTDPKNYRYEVANFYQKRLKIVADGLKELESKLLDAGVEEGQREILRRVTEMGKPPEADDHIPKGAYYLFPSFKFLQGKPIPEELLPVFQEKYEGRNDMVFKNADDLVVALQHAYLLGLQPITVASGTLFYQSKQDKETTMEFRLATIADEADMTGMVNTFKGLAQIVLDPKKEKVDMGATFYDGKTQKETLTNLQQAFPAVKPSATPSTIVNVIELLTKKYIDVPNESIAV